MSFPIKKSLKRLIIAGVFALSSFHMSNSAADPVKKMVFGADIYPPYLFLDDSGALTGIDYDLATEAGRRMGFQPEFRVIEWEKKKKYLESGEVDGIWSCFTMSGREHDFTWAGPYLESNHSVIVKDDSKIHQLSDLNGRKLCVQSTTVPARIFEGSYKVSKSLPSLSELVQFATVEECIAAMLQQGCDAVSAHEEILQATVVEGGFRYLTEPLETADIGVAFRADSSYFAEALTKTFEDMQRDGFIKKVVEKYGMLYHAPSASKSAN